MIEPMLLFIAIIPKIMKLLEMFIIHLILMDLFGDIVLKEKKKVKMVELFQLNNMQKVIPMYHLHL